MAWSFHYTANFCYFGALSIRRRRAGGFTNRSTVSMLSFVTFARLKLFRIRSGQALRLNLFSALGAAYL